MRTHTVAGDTACKLPGLEPAAAPLYSSRRSCETPFYKLVAGHFEDFKAEYKERYEKAFGYWRYVIDNVIERYLRCGVLEYGFARIKCGGCGHEQFASFSCKQRSFCPSCHKKKTLVLSARLKSDVFEKVDHRQIVFTLPKRFRVFFRYNRKLLGKLSKCAWETVRDIYTASGGEAGTPGMVSSIQTFGALVHFHPHIHTIVTNGVFMPWGEYRPLPKVPTEVYLKVWENKVFKLLLAERCITESTVESIRSWRFSGFSVHQDVEIEAGNEEALGKLAEYIARCPLSMSRMIKVTDDSKVIYRAEHTTPIKFPGWQALTRSKMLSRNYEVYDPLDFLAQVTQHIPNKGEHIIRYYGWYSNKSRGQRKKLRIIADVTPVESLPRVHPNISWAILIKHVFEVDPMVCVKCGGEMKVVGFITSKRDITDILTKAGVEIRPSRPPPEPEDALKSLLREPCEEISRDVIYDDLPWG